MTPHDHRTFMPGCYRCELSRDEAMTWLEIARVDWVEVGEHFGLHAVGQVDEPESVDTDWGGDGLTGCGLRGWMSIPGVLTRVGEPRCAECCAQTGLPVGAGSPKNDEACRRLLELETPTTARARSSENKKEN